MSYWEKFKFIWDYDKAAFMRRYMKSSRTIANFEEEILKYKNLEREVLAEESLTAMSFIVVDCTSLKQETVNHCIEWQQMFTALLNELALKDLNHVVDAINSTTDKLKVLPTNLQELSRSVNLLKQQVSDLPEIHDLFEPIQAKYALLQKYEVSIDPKELELLNSLQGRYEQFQQFLAATDLQMKSCKRNMKSDLEKAVASFETDIKTMAERFEASAPTSSKSFTTEQALNELAKVKEKLEQNKVRQMELKDGMAVFDFGLPPSEHMSKTEEELEVLKSLWEMMGEWEQAWDDYKNCKCNVLFMFILLLVIECVCSFSKIQGLGRKRNGRNSWSFHQKDYAKEKGGKRSTIVE
jgi:dynein heavy chain, axonemal